MDMFQLLNSVNSSYISILWNIMQTLKMCFWKYTSIDVKSLQRNFILGFPLCIQCTLVFLKLSISGLKLLEIL